MGLDPTLAAQVAEQLKAKDALAAHAWAEPHIFHMTSVRPIQTAPTSAATLVLGAALLLEIVRLTTVDVLVPAMWIAALASLVVLGAAGTRLANPVCRPRSSA